MNHQKVAASLIPKFFLLALCLALALITGNFKSGLTQLPKEERKLNVHTFNRMPLKVKEVRNLQKEEDWFRDLEIEVQNISKQPIYFISLGIEFPDIESPPPETRADGSTPSRSVTGFGLTYGEDRLMDVRELAGPDDIPLKPGEKYVFTIPKVRVLGFESMNRERNLSPKAWNKSDIEIDTISFGDATGLIGGQRKVYYEKKSAIE